MLYWSTRVSEPLPKMMMMMICITFVGQNKNTDLAAPISRAQFIKIAHDETTSEQANANERCGGRAAYIEYIRATPLNK